MKIIFLLLISSVSYGQLLPDKNISPGDTDPKVTQESIDKTICVKRYTAGVRNVTEKTKRLVVSKYIKAHPEWPKCKPAGGVACEIDHVISLELGGSNSIRNLFPQPYCPLVASGVSCLGAREKDKLENYLHRQVCDKFMSLAEAQESIRTDWVSTYLKMIDEE